MPRYPQGCDQKCSGSWPSKKVTQIGSYIRPNRSCIYSIVLVLNATEFQQSKVERRQEGPQRLFAAVEWGIESADLRSTTGVDSPIETGATLIAKCVPKSERLP